MGWYALEELEEAFENTRELLYPIERGTWLRLGLLVIFTGGGLSFPNFPSGGFEGDGMNAGSGIQETAIDQNTELKQIANQTALDATTAAFTSARTAGLIAALLVLVSLAVVFVAISSIFEFIYYQSLIDREVRIRENFREHTRNGLRFMLLRILFSGAALLLVAGSVLGIALNPLLGILGALALAVIFIPVAVIMGLVNNFVIPETIRTEQGFWNSLRTGLGKAREELDQTLIYVLVRFGLKLVTGTAMLIYIMLVLVLELIVFGLLGAAMYFISPLLVAIPALIGVLILIGAIVAGQVVIQTYLNFYALKVFENFGG